MGIRNIWQNDFYNESPVSKWAWEIDFSSFLPDATIEAYKLAKYTEILNKAIVSCVWGKREMSVVNTYFGGIQANYPGRIQNAGEFNIKFNENQTMLVSQTLEILFNLQSHDQNYFKNSDSQGYTYDSSSQSYIKDNVIRLKIKKNNYDIGNKEKTDSNVIALLEFHNCFIKGINEEELSYENMEDVLTRTVSISYDYMIYGKVTETLKNNENEVKEENRRREEEAAKDAEAAEQAAKQAAAQADAQAASQAVARNVEAAKQNEARANAQDARMQAVYAEKARQEAEAKRKTEALEGEKSSAQEAYLASQRARAQREEAESAAEAKRKKNEEKTRVENEKWQSRGNAKRS